MKIRNSEEDNKGPFKRPFAGRFLFTMSAEGYVVEFHKVNYFVETSLLVNKHKMGFQPLPRSPQPPSHKHERIKLRTPRKQIADNLL